MQETTPGTRRRARARHVGRLNGPPHGDIGAGAYAGVGRRLEVLRREVPEEQDRQIVGVDQPDQPVRVRPVVPETVRRASGVHLPMVSRTP